MSRQLTLYSRVDCCLCEEMKAVVSQVAKKIPLTVVEVDIDSSPDLQKKYGEEVPVLFIGERKAFKYRVTARELEQRLRKS